MFSPPKPRCSWKNVEPEVDIVDIFARWLGMTVTAILVSVNSLEKF